MAKRKRIKQIVKTKPLELYDHQVEVVEAYDGGIRSFFLPWHRRAGKDVFGMDFIRERMDERVGNYWHMFPFHVQAKRAIWNGIDPDEHVRFIERAFPLADRASTNETEMSIKRTNGSMYQMLGSDNYDRMIGAPPCGILFSEWALCDPAALDFIRPILIQNKGWMAFITTFRGRNHAWRLYQHVKDLPDWFCSLKTVRDTYKHDGSPIVSEEDIAKLRREGMSESLIQQEFYCDPDAVSEGAVFNKQHARLMRLNVNESTPNRVLHCAWGIDGQFIASVLFMSKLIVGMHWFKEQNIADCVQSIARRYPDYQVVHHARNPDTSMFGELDGFGIVTPKPKRDQVYEHGRIAILLNKCDVTKVSKDAVTDFTLAYTPFRDTREDNEHTESISDALSIMADSEMITKPEYKKVDYTLQDRRVI